VSLKLACIHGKQSCQALTVRCRPASSLLTALLPLSRVIGCGVRDWLDHPVDCDWM